MHAAQLLFEVALLRFQLGEMLLEHLSLGARVLGLWRDPSRRHRGVRTDHDAKRKDLVIAQDGHLRIVTGAHF